MTVVVVALVGAACGRGGGLGAAEAVEILVIDGVERDRAECIVEQLEAELSLEKITGLDTDLADDELGQLSATSNACAPILLDGGGITGGSHGIEDPPEELLWWEQEPDLDALIEGLVRGGVEPEVATCMGVAVEESPQPHTAAVDERFLADALLVCST